MSTILCRARLVALAARAKKLGALDLALRYNPLARAHVLRAIALFRAAADLPGRRALAEALTASTVAHARTTRYGRAFGPSLAEWPVLPKAQIRDCPEDFVRPGVIRVPAATSGSTGLPLRLTRSAACVAAEQAFLDSLLPDRALTWARARIAILRGDLVKSRSDRSPPYAYETHGGRRLVLSSPHLDHDTLPWYRDRIAAFVPDILWIFPTMAANLLRLLETTGSRLHVPLVMLSSERAEAGLHRALERVLGARVVNYYGLAERTCLAISRDPASFLFEPAYGRVELIPTDQDEVADGYRHVPIIATGYWNKAMPLVRYDTGDRAIVPADADACGLEAIALGLLPFEGIAGRSGDFVYTESGTQICGLNQLPREVGHLLQLQIVQEPSGTVVVRALAGPGFSTADLATLDANTRAKLPVSLSYRIEHVTHLELGAGGKMPFVIRHFSPPSAGELRRDVVAIASGI